MQVCLKDSIWDFASSNLKGFQANYGISLIKFRFALSIPVLRVTEKFIFLVKCLWGFFAVDNCE